MAFDRSRVWLVLGMSAFLAIGSVAWFLRQDRGVAPLDGAVPEGAALPPNVSGTAAPVASSPPESPLPSSEPPPITVAPAAIELSAALLRKDDPAGALQAVEQLLYFYRQGLGENPVGQNEDIVAAMLGENSKRAAFLPPNSPAIKDGKLLDPWGTPYWFHPVSRDRMEIRSAGPDRDLFTSDDLRNE